MNWKTGFQTCSSRKWIIFSSCSPWSVCSWCFFWCVGTGSLSSKQASCVMGAPRLTVFQAPSSSVSSFDDFHTWWTLIRGPEGRFTDGDLGKTVVFRSFFPYDLEVTQPDCTRRDATAFGDIRILSRIDRLFVNSPWPEETWFPLFISCCVDPRE